MPRDARRTFGMGRGIRTTARQFLAQTLGSLRGASSAGSTVSNNAPTRQMNPTSGVSSRGRDAKMD